MVATFMFSFVCMVVGGLVLAVGVSNNDPLTRTDALGALMAFGGLAGIVFAVVSIS